MIFVVTMHLSISVFRLSSVKFEEVILDFFLLIYVVMLTAKLSDLLDSSNFLFLRLTDSEIAFTTDTLASVAPSFFAKSKQYVALDSKYV